jgi:MraZ protein
MNRFLTSATNRIDAKGRVSVPAHFRSVLMARGGPELYAQRALGLAAFNVAEQEQLARWEERLSACDPLDPFAEDLQTHVYADGVLIKMDQDGRIAVTDFIREHTGITDEVTFSGMGSFFRLWTPQSFETFREEARARLVQRRADLAVPPAVGQDR